MRIRLYIYDKQYEASVNGVSAYGLSKEEALENLRKKIERVVIDLQSIDYTDVEEFMSWRGC